MEISLKEIVSDIVSIDSNVCAIFLFGSRRDNGANISSDIDLILMSDRPMDKDLLRDISSKYLSYPDFFYLNSNRLISILNNCYLEADTQDELLRCIGAEIVWSSTLGVDPKIERLHFSVKPEICLKHTGPKRHGLNELPKELSRYLPIQEHA